MHVSSTPSSQSPAIHAYGGQGSPGGYGPPPGGGYGPPPGGGYGPPPGGGYGPPPGGGYGPPPGGGYGGPMAPQGGQYEFGPAEDAVIDKTSTWAMAAAILGFIEGGLQILGGNLAGGFVIAIAWFFYQGAKALKTVVQTQGHDVHHVVAALEQFGTAFHVRFILTMIGLGLIFIVAILVFAIIGVTML